MKITTQHRAHHANTHGIFSDILFLCFAQSTLFIIYNGSAYVLFSTLPMCFLFVPLFTFCYLTESDRVWVHTRKYRIVRCTWYLNIWWFLDEDKNAITAFYKNGPHFSKEIEKKRYKKKKEENIYIFSCDAWSFDANVRCEYIFKVQKITNETMEFAYEIDLSKWIFTHLFHTQVQWSRLGKIHWLEHIFRFHSAGKTMSLGRSDILLNMLIFLGQMFDSSKLFRMLGSNQDSSNEFQIH